MPNYQRLQRMVSFRLSEEEYQLLKEKSEAAHSRSVSDMARVAMHFWLRHGFSGNDYNFQDKIAELEARVSQLSAEVERIDGDRRLTATGGR